MKNILSIIMLFCSAAVYGQSYQLVWEDNFNGNSLDSSIWNIVEREGVWNTGSNAELQFYKTENIEVGDDGEGNNCLIIKSFKENYNGYSFTSGRVNTNSKFSFRYGKIEARIKIPDLENGLWPAFWAQGYSSLSWPNRGETDIMEMGHRSGITIDSVNSYLLSATHWESNDIHTYSAGNIVSTADLSKDYHIYSMEWTPDYIKTYLDGDNLIYNFTIESNDKEEFTEFMNYILLNVAVGGGLPGITNPAEINAPFPSAMYIDYIRLYQEEGQEEFTQGSHPIHGTFGVYSENNVCINMNTEFDAEISKQGLNTYGTIPYEGFSTLGYTIKSSEAFSISINSLTARNMTNYTAGGLNFYIKTDFEGTLVLSMSDHEGKQSSMNLDNTKYFNPLRDNNWHLVSVPIEEFTGNADIMDLRTMFSLSGQGEAEIKQLALDHITWNEEYTGSPIDNSYFGIYADHEDIPAGLNFSGSDNIYIWSGFSNYSGSAFYGENVLNYSPSSSTWNGFGIHSALIINLSAYFDGYLNFSIKTTSTNAFRIGLKNDLNEAWQYQFTEGYESASFKRNGEWCVISIKLSDFVKSETEIPLTQNNLNNIGIVFYLVGDINFSIDEIYLSKEQSQIVYDNENIEEKEDDRNDIKYFPVPSEDFLNIAGIRPETRITIYGLDGRKLFEKEVNFDYTIDLSSFASGIYILHIKSDKENIKKLFSIK